MVDSGLVLERLHDYVERHWAELQTVGLSVALTDRERALGSIAHGFADLEARKPVAEPLFQIGSISKGLTAIALLQEAEAGRVDLDAPVTEYLPWFAVPSSFGPITLHHLLTHTSGLVSGTEFTGDAAHEVWSLRETTTGSAPGERMRYSNVGYKTLGLVLSRVAGRSWWEVVRERVMAPIGMGDAEPIITHDVRDRLAVGYAPRYDDRPWFPRHGWVPATWVESATADGTICATAEQLIGYARLLLNGGAAPGGRVLSSESFARMTTPVAVDPDEPTEVYGYGVKWIVEGDERRFLGHSGTTIGYTAYVLVDTETGFGVAVLANTPVSKRLDLARFALACLAASAAGTELPAVPAVPDRRSIPDAERYAGAYLDGSGAALSVVAEGSHLFLQGADGRAALEPLGPDVFGVDAPELERFVARFVQEGSEVVELVHGPNRFVRDGRAPAPTTAHPPEWSALPGHYRSWNPWAPSFRVFLRAGTLWLEMTGDTIDGAPDAELHPLEDGSFRVGGVSSPDRVRFDVPIDGLTTRALYDAAPYYRTFTL